MASAAAHALRSLDRLRTEVERAEYEVLAVMRQEATPWREIAEVYGVTVQAARQRFDRLAKRHSSGGGEPPPP